MVRLDNRFTRLINSKYLSKLLIYSKFPYNIIEILNLPVLQKVNSEKIAQLFMIRFGRYVLFYGR